MVSRAKRRGGFEAKRAKEGKTCLVANIIRIVHKKDGTYRGSIAPRLICEDIQDIKHEAFERMKKYDGKTLRKTSEWIDVLKDIGEITKKSKIASGISFIIVEDKKDGMNYIEVLEKKPRIVNDFIFSRFESDADVYSGKTKRAAKRGKFGHVTEVFSLDI